ncbi:MAG: hypothetical protein IT425_07525, partial [Pirellulales bacterium]|nr:hypothetical protein [Pirellulales bacterium]
KGVHDKEQAHDDGHGHEGHHHRDHDARVASLYASYSTTPLQATVRSDGKNEFKFVVKHPK